MDKDKVFKYIKASQFIPDYTNIPYNSRFRQKTSGTDGNGQDIKFTEEEKKEIIKGLKKMFKDLTK